MKKATKKKVMLCCSIIIIIILSIASFAVINRYNYYNDPFRWGYCISNDDFNKSEKSFQSIADVVIKYSTMTSDSKDICISIGYDKSSHNRYLTLISKETQTLPIGLTEREQKDLNIVVSQFKDKDAQLEAIYVYQNRISFSTNNGLYTLVYSPDDKKPTFLNKPDEDTKFRVKKIKNCWYNVVQSD